MKDDFPKIRGREEGMAWAIMGAMAFFIKPILTPFSVWVINGVEPNATALIAVVFIVAASRFAALKKEKVCKAKNFNG